MREKPFKISEKRTKVIMKYSALLVAMSVGASIVIARPEDAEPLRANIDDENNRPKSGKSTLLQRIRWQAKGLAVKTFNLGRIISYKTANATHYISDRIGDTITSLVK